jgi:wyosine [tRNA(Phe)-imidazoG37] synthetase (radical SAM superfamily)
MVCREELNMLLELKKEIIYGPVNSRRLGRSLGINILPARRKICPFNCVYCQYGWTKDQVLRINPNPDLPSVDAVKEALEKALIDMNNSPSYITFSGNGEPSLHPDFSQIVEEVTDLRDRLAPEAKTAILSNSALVSDISLRKALSRLDVRIMKLDCGTSDIFKRYNQPCSGVDLEVITEGLAHLPDVDVQTLVSAGQAGNLDTQDTTVWIERLKHIRPLSVQLYTLDRGYPDKNLRPANQEDLDDIKARVQKAGIRIGVF